MQLVRWFDARLVECPPPPSPLVRVYGLEVIDADRIDELAATAVRVVFLDEVADSGEELSPALMARASAQDAVELVHHRWLPKGDRAPRPGAYAQRRRARVVRVVADCVALAIRFDDDPDAVVFSNAA